MPEHPSVSVLMTVYDGMPYLRQAIESVLSQTFSDFEFIIVDDASTDDSVACIRSYTDPRIRLVRNECNQGQASSLNKGLALAKGKYIARLDQDDVSLPKRFEKQVIILNQREDIAIVGTRMIGMNAQGQRHDLLGKTVKNYGSFVGFLLLGICPICHPSVMFRRDVVERVGGYHEECAPAEDVDLWARLAFQRHNAYVLNEPLALYRMHSGQQSVLKNKKQLDSIRRIQEQWITKFCPSAEVRGVTLLLSMNSDLWKEYPTQSQLRSVFQAFHEMMTDLESTLELSSEEKVSFRRVLDRWLGPGVRLGRTIGNWPSFLFYPAVWLLSPLLVPRVRPVLSSIARSIRRVRRYSFEI